MQWHRSGLIASWEFVEDHIERNNVLDYHLTEKPLVQKHSEQKWGAMVIIKSLQFLPTILEAALKEMAPDLHGSIQLASHGNMMHIALAGINNQMSLLQDR